MVPVPLGLYLFSRGSYSDYRIEFLLECPKTLKAEAVKAVRMWYAQGQERDKAVGAAYHEILTDENNTVEVYKREHPEPAKPKGPAQGTGDQYKAYQVIRESWKKLHDEWCAGYAAAREQLEPRFDAARASIPAHPALEEFLRDYFLDPERMLVDGGLVRVKKFEEFNVDAEHLMSIDDQFARAHTINQSTKEIAE